MIVFPTPAAPFIDVATTVGNVWGFSSVLWTAGGLAGLLAIAMAFPIVRRFFGMGRKAVK